ncbi:hypothetical protein HNQ79_002380 [Streptomyces candidus]|uniref:Uncharacterized protein n=1 Tax=Streptomyces candidus TaxID=67283 RepID=A0A7X0HE22_9ACTN|nr:hypothetical protein [Streptomyces candidus]GHH42960.1 hypothetical protein GCM10018773_28180 [Streptomyces candidus]
MVAAHAWDLRGAQGLGMRTAYVARPVGDPPASSDGFDLHAVDLADLADQATRPVEVAAPRAGQPDRSWFMGSPLSAVEPHESIGVQRSVSFIRASQAHEGVRAVAMFTV